MLKLAPTREDLEAEISIISTALVGLNEIIEKGNEAAKEADRLRKRLREAQMEYLGAKEAIEFKPLFAFKGTTKDLLERLQQEVEKAQM